MDLVDRKTGKLVSIPDDEVQGAFKSGLYGLPKGASLPVAHDASGLVGKVDAKDAAKAIATGSRVAPEEYRKAEEEAKYGGVGGAVGALGAGIARGAGEAFGLPSDAMATDLAGLFGQSEYRKDSLTGKEKLVGPMEATRERLNAYKERHPYVSMGGEGIGLVGATALGGGAMGAAGALGERLLPKALAATGRSALEGGLIGGVSAMNESALGDTDLNAEKVIAGIGQGVFVGGAAGALLSGAAVGVGEARDAAGRWMQKLRPTEIDSLATKHFGYEAEGLGEAVAKNYGSAYRDAAREAGVGVEPLITPPPGGFVDEAAQTAGRADGIGNRVQKAYAKASASLSGKDHDVIDKLTELSPEGSEARRIAVFDAPKIQEEASRAIRQQADELLASGDLVAAEAKGGLKASYVAKAVKTGNSAEVLKSTQANLQRLIDGAEGELGQDVAPQMVKAVESVSKSAYRAQQEIAEAFAGGAGAEANAKAFIALDNVKRDIQRLTSSGYRGVQNIADPIDKRLAQRTVGWLDGAAKDLRGGLEDTELWGKAAQDQQAINAAWTKQIDASKRFHQALTTEVGRDPLNPYLQRRGVDPTKAESYVRGLVNPNNDLTHKAVTDFVGSTQDLAQAIKKSYDLPADKLAEVERVHAAANAFGGTVKKAEKSLVLANQYRHLTERSSDSLTGLLGTVGFAAGGLPGGAIGSAIGAIASPGRTVAQLASVERLLTKVDSRIGSSIRGFFRGGGTTKALPAISEVSSPGGFGAAVKLLSEAQSNPEALTQMLGKSLGDLPSAAPRLSVAITMAVQRISGFLYSKVPPGMTDPYNLVPEDNEALVSDAERDTFAAYWEAAWHPDSVLASLEKGQVTPEESEALKACHPNLYTEASKQIDRMVVDGKAKNLSYDKVVSLGVLFDRPTDPTLSPELLQATKAAMAKMPAGGDDGPNMGGPPAKPLALASSFQTTFEAAQRRASGGPKT